MLELDICHSPLSIRVYYFELKKDNSFNQKFFTLRLQHFVTLAFATDST